MESHDQYEVQIEMRAHGALDAPASAALDQHLATCPSCRAFAEGARRQEEHMKAEAQAANQAADWERIRKGLARIDLHYRRYLTWAPVLAMLLALTPLLLHGTGRVAMVPLAIMLLIIVGAQTGEARRRRREAASFELERAGALGFWRRELDTRIGQLSTAAPLSLLCGAILVVMACLDPTPWGVASAALLTASGAWQRFVELPRLRRERAGLD